MTAHPPKPTITPEWVERFAAYYRLFPDTWGVFHVSLCDGNWECGAMSKDEVARQIANGWDAGYWRSAWPPGTDEMVAFFESLTPSQRRRLGRKAEAL